MPMGYGSNFAETVEEKSVKEICPEELKAFEQAIKEAGVEDIGEFAQGISNGDNADDLETGQTYKALCDAFEERTRLYLGLGYHDATEQGSCYDDVDGYFWWVDGVYEETEQAEKFQELGHQIQRKFYVTFG